MLVIPYAGLQPVAISPQLPVMQAPRPYESLAQRNAASVLPMRPPAPPAPPDILGQIAAGAQTAGQLQKLFSKPLSQMGLLGRIAQGIFS